MFENLSGQLDEVFNKLRFDTNLKRWAYMEDLDFSCLVCYDSPKFLYAIPHAKIIHKVSDESRLPSKLNVYMITIYWSYIFFKDVFNHSLLNLASFLWALTGNVLATTGELLINKRPKRDWWNLIFLIKSYYLAFRNLRNILLGKLDFFNNTFKN